MFNIHKMDFLSLLKIGIPAWLKVIHSMNFECKTWSHRGRPTTGRIRMRPLQSCSGAGTGWNCVKASQLGRSTTEYDGVLKRQNALIAVISLVDRTDGRSVTALCSQIDSCTIESPI